MIVVDGSALLAILLDEDDAVRCQRALVDESLLVSAGSLAEMLVVAARKGVLEAMQQMLDTLQPEVAPLTQERALRAAEAYQRWGKGFGKAKLNICDSFAYALAREYDCPLLYVGNDFAQTDVLSALPRLQ